MEQPKTNTIIISKNKFKTDGDSKPDITGRLVLPNGTEQDVSLWLKEGKDGSKFYSGTFKDKYQKPIDAPQATPQPQVEDLF